MAIDGGTQGLAQSRHHPDAELGAVGDLSKCVEAGSVRTTTSGSNTTAAAATITLKLANGLTIKEVLERLVAIALDDHKDEARRLAMELYQSVQTTQPTAKKHDEYNLSELRKVVAEEAAKAATAAVKTALSEAKKESAERSWASIVSNSSTAPTVHQQMLPKKVIPTRLSQQMLIRSAKMPDNLAKRTPLETVQAVNQVSAQKGAIAARALPSGDVLVTFKDQATKEWHAKNKDWIQKAFGQQAKEAQRTVAILVKGLRTQELEGVSAEVFNQELGLKSVDKVKIRRPHSAELTWATVLVHLTDQEEARKACDNGVVWRAQLLNCEPYSANLEPTQCYKCWQWGHTQRYCTKEPLCPRCGTKAHGEGGRAGEDLCPTHKGLACTCPACGGRHTAWAKECPVGAQARVQAREAYQYRPRTFQPTAPPPVPQGFTASRPTPVPTLGAARGTPAATPQQSLPSVDEEEGFQEVRRKRGRPSTLEAASRDPTQTKIRFTQQTISQPSLSQASTSHSTQGVGQGLATACSSLPSPPEPAEFRSQESEWL